MLTCGPGGSTGAEILAEINRLGSLPISSISTNAPLDAVPLTTTPVGLIVGNTNTVLRPGILINTGEGFTLDAGLYEIHYNASMSYDVNEVFNIDGILGGVSMSGGNGIYVTGRGGSSPTPVCWGTTFEAQDGDILSFTAKAVTGSGTLTVYMSSVTIKAL